LKYVDPTGHWGWSNIKKWCKDHIWHKNLEPIWNGLKSGVQSVLGEIGYWAGVARRTADEGTAYLNGEKSGSDVWNDVKTGAKWVSQNREFVAQRIANAALIGIGAWGVRGLVGAAFSETVAISAQGENGGLGATTNSIPTRLARVIPGEGSFPNLGKRGDSMVHVTAAEDIAGLNAQQLQQRLQIEPSSTYTVIEFSVNMELYSAPTGPTVPGGGARQWLIQNGPIPADATITVIK